MDKPIVFFSHSSTDKDILIRLKELIDERTGRAIDIFLSSDGQSIPLGKNWVKKVEDALQNASMMFVFISPNSYTSNWLNFEAGYVYSRNVEVIPIGILGLDLYQISPPLSLLQGFNLNKASSLDNIIATINKKCQTTFETTFTEDQYIHIFSANDLRVNNSPISYINIDFRLLTPPEEDELLLTIVEEKIKKLNINLIGPDRGEFISHGFRLSHSLTSRIISISMDKLVANIYLPILQEFIEEEKFTPEEANIYFEFGYILSNDDYLRQSALLRDTDVLIKEGHQFDFKGVRFMIGQVQNANYGNNIMMNILFNNNFISDEWLDKITKLLIDMNVIVLMKTIFKNSASQSYLF